MCAETSGQIGRFPLWILSLAGPGSCDTAGAAIERESFSFRHASLLWPVLIPAFVMSRPTVDGRGPNELLAALRSCAAAVSMLVKHQRAKFDTLARRSVCRRRLIYERRMRPKSPLL